MNITIKFAREELEAMVRRHVGETMLPPDHEIEEIESRYGLIEMTLTIRPRPHIDALKASAA